MSEGGGTVIDTPHGIRMFHLLQLRSALKLEIAGMRHSKGSVYAYVKRELGFRGNKQRVWDQLDAHIKAIQALEVMDIKCANCSGTGRIGELRCASCMGTGEMVF